MLPASSLSILVVNRKMAMRFDPTTILPTLVMDLGIPKNYIRMQSKSYLLSNLKVSNISDLEYKMPLNLKKKNPNFQKNSILLSKC